MAPSRDGILADLLGVPQRAVSILSGHHSRGKRIAVAGIAVDTAKRVLEAASSS